MKWSDKSTEDAGEIAGLLRFSKEQKLRKATVTTRRISGQKHFGDVQIDFIPASFYCYALGHNIISAEGQSRLAIGAFHGGHPAPAEDKG